MCHKIRLFNFHFKVLISESTIKVKILPNITKFWWVDFEKLSSGYHCFFRRHVCLSNLKHAPSRESPLTTRKTVLSHLKLVNFQVDFRLINTKLNSKKKWIMLTTSELTAQTFWTRKKTLKIAGAGTFN